MTQSRHSIAAMPNWNTSRRGRESAFCRSTPLLTARMNSFRCSTAIRRPSQCGPRRKREHRVMWGVIPAAGRGSRIQPLAFSKELLPVGSRINGGTEQPRAVSEYLVERMLAGGADKLWFVISPGKSDNLGVYWGGHFVAFLLFLGGTPPPRPWGGR